MLEWFYDNDTLIWWLAAVSILSLLLTLIVVPLILIRLPEDYFQSAERHRVAWPTSLAFLRLPFLLLKNLIGMILIVSGILMLVLPGQGLLTIIIGLIVMEFPGKYHAECWLISRPTILQSVNWIRAKAGRPLLTIQSAE